MALGFGKKSDKAKPVTFHDAVTALVESLLHQKAVLKQVELAGFDVGKVHHAATLLADADQYVASMSNVGG